MATQCQQIHITEPRKIKSKSQPLYEQQNPRQQAVNFFCNYSLQITGILQQSWHSYIYNSPVSKVFQSKAQRYSLYSIQ